ncbi:unnamed protein product [Lactuca saligna]|uniref:Peptidase A1 domain-containing protein n=1 Tax=Lactuca saligna TaxID=75948 RepID=A0AA35YIC6_LACSI|nr:unnamed protein product [Lactuca saligna]
MGLVSQFKAPKYDEPNSPKDQFQWLYTNGLLGWRYTWCIGFQRVQNGVLIFGDIVLKDKIFVYDLSKKRIGWTDYDCSSDVNVFITSSKDEFKNAGELNESTSSRTTSVLQALWGFVNDMYKTNVILMLPPHLIH